MDQEARGPLCSKLVATVSGIICIIYMCSLQRGEYTHREPCGRPPVWVGLGKHAAGQHGERLAVRKRGVNDRLGSLSK